MNELAKYNEINAESADEIVVRYATLVKRIAHHLLGRLPQTIQPDDLIQAGMIGLLEAAKNYDPSKGASFETYAGIRIRGAMLDEIRKGDWVPRSVYRNARKVAETIRSLEHQMGADVRDSDVANALDMTLQEYHQLLKGTCGARILAYEDLGVTEEMLKDGLSSSIPEPLDGIQDQDFKEYLAKQIASLKERERLVLSLYYDEELNLREIGEVLGVTESRVCQIHGHAMVLLQARMKDWNK